MFKLTSYKNLIKNCLFLVILTLMTTNVCEARVAVSFGFGPVYAPGYYAPYGDEVYIPGHWAHGVWIPGHYVEDDDYYYSPVVQPDVWIGGFFGGGGYSHGWHGGGGGWHGGGGGWHGGGGGHHH